jgi:type I restriction enzyme M protein
VNHSEIVSFLWGVADLIRDTFKRGKYQDVILPLTVLRGLDCVLAPTKDKVLRADAPQLAANLRNYIAGFSQNMREVLERSDFDNTISKLNEAGLLFKVLERFKTRRRRRRPARRTSAGGPGD